jgi:hypothetical protein
MEGTIGSPERGRRWPTRRGISWERSPLQGHHPDASSVVIEMICWSDSAVMGILLDPNVHSRSVLYWCILARLRAMIPAAELVAMVAGGANGEPG